MKRQLLLGTALFAAISAFPQATKIKPAFEPVNMASKIAQKYNIIDNANESAAPTNATAPIGPKMQNAERSSAVAPIVWQSLTGSMNIFGVLVSESKPLNYDDDLKVVSFIHRKSFTYVPSPLASPSPAASGCIVAELSTDWGGSWDSTLIWNNNTQFARYPQGGVYNPPGNKNLGNTNFAVVMGPITTGSGWIGSYMASKALDTKGSLTYDNVASTAPNAQQFFANTPPFGATGKFDFPRTYFSATDDGMIRAVGRINADVNANTLGLQAYRGARILKGTFNSGVFNWSGDSIIPPNINNGGGFKNLLPDQAHMAWNEAGTTGYMVFMGCDTTRTLSNRGLQPIVYKTTNSGSSWTSVQGIDFNAPAMQSPVIDHIVPVRTNSNLVIPQFNTGEGISVTVDMNDRLHIMACLLPTFSSHRDSLLFSYNFTAADNEQYNYRHTPGERPYIYDFYQTASGWTVAVVDSMSTEGPSPTSGGNGYNDNPWKADPTNQNSKQNCDARMQMSRTPDGKFIVYTWSESDTTITNSNHKWNHLPNLKARVMDVAAGTIHPKEIDMTNPISGGNPLVKYRATMHYVSPKCDYGATKTIGGPILVLPATVSNDQNTPMEQVLACTHWYTSARLEFGKLDEVGVNENTLSDLQNVVVFPNPASNEVSVLVNLAKDSKVKIEVFNTVGQLVKSVSADAQAGENNVSVNLTGLTSGIYMVNIKSGNLNATKKLVVE